MHITSFRINQYLRDKKNNEKYSLKLFSKLLKRKKQTKMKSITAKIFSVLIIITVSITVFFACKKTNPVGETSTPVNTVAGSVSGQITDLNNLPVSNATVTAGTST